MFDFGPEEVEFAAFITFEFVFVYEFGANNAGCYVAGFVHDSTAFAGKPMFDLFSGFFDPFEALFE